LLILFVFITVLGPGPTLKIAWLPFFLLGVAIFGLGLAWFISALNVFFKDIAQVLSIVLRVCFYFTPIIYPASLVPEKFQAWIAMNPMVYPVEGYRMALLGRTDPDPMGLLILFAWGVTALTLGGLVFKRLKPIFADVM